VTDPAAEAALVRAAFGGGADKEKDDMKILG
jgi:hypothetical protein